jgi:tRNA U34 5-methylaminomethyl-2-thiouridine-forming methyltransferase MnmC
MITLEPTADGSNTLYVPELNEHYHSVKGALTESAHIFIQMGLNHAQAANPRVLEIGFGTGLNAFLTLLEAEKSQRAIHFTSISEILTHTSEVSTPNCELQEVH